MFIYIINNMGRKAKDWSYLKGQKYGYLTIIEDGFIKNNHQKVLVRCDCGIEKYVGLGNILCGNIKSCGCKKSEIISKTNIKHGMWSTYGIYNIFRCIKSRCNNINNKDYNKYGGRGIKCLWQNFEEFYIDMGESYKKHCDEFGKENTTIDRIDNNGNYCKENCRWATRKVQANNKSNNHIIKYNGKEYKITELGKILGIDRSYIKRELDKGLSIYDIIGKSKKHIIQ